MFDKRVKRMPPELTCPITGVSMIWNNYPTYTSSLGKSWRYDHFNNVFIEIGGLHVYRNISTNDATIWCRMTRMKYLYGTSVNIRFVEYPRTNGAAFIIWINNLLIDNSITKWAVRLWRKAFPPKIVFPVVKRIQATTVASELVSVKPMETPTSTLLYFDIVSDPGFSTETNEQEHVIVMKSTKTN